MTTESTVQLSGSLDTPWPRHSRIGDDALESIRAYVPDKMTFG